MSPDRIAEEALLEVSRVQRASLMARPIPTDPEGVLEESIAVVARHVEGAPLPSDPTCLWLTTSSCWAVDWVSARVHVAPASCTVIAPSLG